jgi:hypothetical protein
VAGSNGSTARFQVNDGGIERSIVRPDTLTNRDEVIGHELHSSPTSSPIFNPGRTSRINVTDFMADLTTDGGICKKWTGQMPVIYNRVLS